jgi:hypothetical protein
MNITRGQTAVVLRAINTVTLSNQQIILTHMALLMCWKEQGAAEEF